MKYVRELSNKNKIVSEHTRESAHDELNSDYTIKFVFSGAENCEINKRKLSIYPDSFAVFNEGTHYHSKIDSITPVETLTVSFGKTFINDFHNTILSSDDILLDGQPISNKPIFIESLYPFEGDIKYNMLHLKKQLDKGLDNEMLINEYMHHCLLNYYKIYHKEIVQKIDRLTFSKTKTREEVLRRLTLAKEYINSNYNQAITLEAVADHACLSVNHLMRTFKEAYEISPYQFLIQLRLNRAKNLLQTTSYSLTEIVGLVGFECPSSFIRLFKNTFNITPLKYKKSRLN